MKTNKTMTKFLGAAALLVALGGCSNDLDFNGAGETRTITAEIMDPSTETRSCVDSETLGLGFLGMMWEPGDKIGIYGTADVNVPFTNDASENARKTTFSGQSQGMIQYAYYPWSADNNGVAVTALKGNLPEEQTVCADYHVDADYKYGTVENGTIDTNVKFNHLLSLARLEINASGTSLSSENIQSIAFSATHGSEPVKMSGDFNFNATNGKLNLDNTTGTVAKAVWQGGSALTTHITGFISMLPTLKAGDKLDIVLLTDKQKVSFHVTLAVDFSAGSVYTFPLSLSAYADKEEYGWKSEPVTPDTEYTETTGTFTCAALNVDGLPAKVTATIIGFIPVTHDVNPNGPQAEGTKLISQAAARAGWDFFAVSEDFDFDTELKSALTDYNHGTYRAPGNWGDALSSTLDTDGLNFFWKKGITASNEYIEAYNSKYGDLLGGANTCIKKGFRHYEVTVAEGVVIDVYITHMNTYSSNSNYMTAQMSQLAQLRDYVVGKAKANNRPAIIMGDTNMRYTRHAIEEQFINVINSKGLSVNDPWIDFHRNGKYPTHGSKSLMINSKFYKDEKDKESGWYDTKNDICCYDNNKGEVVDKIFYINVPGAPLQLKADYYKNDDSDNFVNASKNASHEVTGITYEDENFNIHENYSTTINKRWGLADHFPAVAGFTWTLRTPKK